MVFSSAWITIAINQLWLKSENPLRPCSEQIPYQIMDSVFYGVDGCGLTKGNGCRCPSPKWILMLSTWFNWRKMVSQACTRMGFSMQRLMGCNCLMLRLWQRHCKFKSRDLISNSKKNSNALNFPQLLNYWTDSATRKRLNCVVH